MIDLNTLLNTALHNAVELVVREQLEQITLRLSALENMTEAQALCGEDLLDAKLKRFLKENDYATVTNVEDAVSEKLESARIVVKF